MREEPTATAAAIAPKPSRPAAMRGGGGGGGGEIVEVQGGHIVRSTGRKDRHSKVCTAKGPRDRRVRLSAHTAIQFYDVQDRLGYDRPSKAVDWLIKKAKTAIDELAQLPAWNPTATCSSSLAPLPQQQQHHRQSPVDDPVIASSNRTLPEPEQFTTTSQQQQLGDNNNNSSSGKYKYNSVGSASGSGFLPGSLDTDIADTIKSFFPTATTSLQNYPLPPDLLSRTASGGGGGSQQDLRLSLQSFQDPAILLQQPHHQQQQHVLFAGTTATLGFDGGWSEQQQQQDEHEHGRLLHRMVAWSANAAADAGGNSGHGTGFVFGAAGAPAVPVFGGHGQYFSQRGPLQSSNTPSVRAWIDPSMTATAVVADHHNHHHYLLPAVHQASVSGGGFAASGGGFSGFRIPARIQGGEEHDGVSDKPSSASSDSRH